MSVKNLLLCMVLAAFAVSSYAANPKVLVFSKTTGMDHGTKTILDSLIKAMGAANGFDVDVGTDAAVYFTDAKLAEYKAVYFNCEGDTVLNDSQEVAFQRYIRKGNGFLGMHGQADCEYSWPWYGDLLGAWFIGHPYGIQNARVIVVNKTHPSTQFITADTVMREEEWYFWYISGSAKKDPSTNPNIHPLLMLDESSIAPSLPYHAHPISWYQEFEGGRSWYCAIGHSPNYYRDTFIQKHLLGAILWAAGMTGTKTLPANQTVCAGASPKSFSVYDLSGKKMATLSAASHQFAEWRRNPVVAGARLAPGMYLLRTEEQASLSVRPLVIVK